MHAPGMGRQRRGFQPPYRAGATVPSRRQRCISLITKLTLTAKLRAAARRASPASTARTTRSRRSIEYGRVITTWHTWLNNRFFGNITFDRWLENNFG
jgi:hypothetical protein